MNVRDDLIRVIDDLLDDDPRAALIAYRRLAHDELPWLEQRVVLLARSDGWSWAPIGRLLGRTRQSMRERFDHPRLAVRPSRRQYAQQWEVGIHRALADVRRDNDDDPIAW